MCLYLGSWDENIFVDLSLFVSLYNTNFMTKLKFYDFFKNWKRKIICWQYKFFFNLQNHPTFHGEERLVNLERRRECLVGLSILIFYACNHLLCSCWQRLNCSHSTGLIDQIDHNYIAALTDNLYLRNDWQWLYVAIGKFTKNSSTTLLFAKSLMFY